MDGQYIAWFFVFRLFFVDILPTALFGTILGHVRLVGLHLCLRVNLHLCVLCESTPVVLFVFGWELIAKQLDVLPAALLSCRAWAIV